MTDKQVKVDIIGDTTSLKAAYREAEGESVKFTQSQQRVNASLGDLNKGLASGQTTWSGWADKTRMAEEATGDLDDSLTAFLSHLDPTYQAVRKLDQGHDLLTRGLKEGLLSQTQYDSGLALLTKRYGTAAEGADRLRINNAKAANSIMALGREAATGQFTQMPGSFIALSNATNQSIFAILRTIAPIALLAGGVAALAKAFNDGERETIQMNNALAVTSGYAGMTRGTMRELAKEVSGLGTMTIGTSKEIVTALVSSGQLGGQALAMVAKLAESYAAATGRDIEKITPELIKLFADPAKGAAELNRQMHFLSVADQEYIEHLTRIGQGQEAQLLLAQKTADHLPKITQNLGTLEKAWKATAQAASGFWDAALGVGREQTLEEKRAAAEKNLAGLQSRRFVRPGVVSTVAGQVQDLRGDINDEQMEAWGKGQAARDNALQAEASALVKQVSVYQQIAVLKDKITLAGQLEAETTEQQLSKSAAIRSLNRELANITTQSALIRARAEADYSVQKDFADRGQAILESGLKHNLVSYQNYFSAREKLQQFDLDKQIEKTKIELALAREAAGRMEPGTAQRAAAQGQVVGIQGRLVALGNRRGDIERATAEQMGDAYMQLGSQVLTVNATMLEAMGRTVDAQVIRLAQQFGPLIQRLEAEGDAGGAEFVRKLIPIELAKTEFARLQQESERSLTAMGDQEKRLQIENQAGLLTQVELQQKVIALHKLEAQALREKLPALVAAAAANPENKQLLATLEKMRLKIAELDATGAELNRTFEFGARDAMQAWVREVDNAGKAGEHFIGGSLKSIENDLTETFVSGKLTVRSFGDFAIQEFARIQARAVIRPFAEGMSGGLTSIFGSFFGGGNASYAADAASAGGVSDAVIASGILHSGGIAGRNTVPQRYIHAAYFENAPRMHRGGLAGNEMPAILEFGEEVLTRRDPRHRMNGGGAPSLTVNVINQDGPAMDVERSSAPRFDGEGYVIDVWLRKMRNDAGFRDQTRQMLAAPV